MGSGSNRAYKIGYKTGGIEKSDGGRLSWDGDTDWSRRLRGFWRWRFVSRMYCMYVWIYSELTTLHMSFNAIIMWSVKVAANLLFRTVGRYLSISETRYEDTADLQHDSRTLTNDLADHNHHRYNAPTHLALSAHCG